MGRSILWAMTLTACSSSSGSDSAPPPGDGGAIHPPGCTGNVLYVSASKGDDLNDGCDPAKPKKTLGGALGQLQAKNANGTEIHTCVETFRERVVVAYPASIIGGFDCNTWAPGAPDAKTTIEAPADAIEALIAFGAPVGADVRLERLRFVGPSRASGAVAALRFKEGAAPVVRSFAVAGGATEEGIAIGVAIESASPTLEDGIVEAGSARCTTDCKGVVTSGVSINGGNARLRRLRITGGTADVAPTGTYIGSIALDVAGPASAVDADAFSDLEIVHGVGRVGATQPAWGMRVGNATIDLVDSKILPGASASTCVSATCGSFALFSAGSGASVRVRRSRILATTITGAPGTSGVATKAYATYAADRSTLDVASSFVYSPATALGSSATLSLSGSTIVGGRLLANDGGVMQLKSSVLGFTRNDAAGLAVSACLAPSKTTFESSAIIGSPAIFAEVLVDQSGTCTGTGPTMTLADTVAKSNASNTITATSTWRVATSCAGESSSCAPKASCGDPAACLDEVFSSRAPLDGFLLKDGTPCAIAQGGLAIPGVSDDAFKAPRTAPFSMGAHEYDGACSN